MTIFHGDELVRVFLAGSDEWNLFFNERDSVTLVFDCDFYRNYEIREKEINFHGYKFDGMTVNIKNYNDLYGAILNFSDSEWLNATLRWDFSFTGVVLENIRFIDSEINLVNLSGDKKDNVCLRSCEFVNSYLEMKGALDESSLVMLNVKFSGEKQCYINFVNLKSSIKISECSIQNESFLLCKTLSGCGSVKITKSLFSNALMIDEISTTESVEISESKFRGGLFFNDFCCNSNVVELSNLEIQNTLEMVGAEFNNTFRFSMNNIKFIKCDFKLLRVNFITEVVEFNGLDFSVGEGQLVFSKFKAECTDFSIEKSILSNVDFEGSSFDKTNFKFVNSEIEGRMNYDNSRFNDSELSFRMNDISGGEFHMDNSVFNNSNFEILGGNLNLPAFSIENSKFISSDFSIRKIHIDCENIYMRENTFGGKCYLDKWYGTERIDVFLLGRNEFEEQVTLPAGNYNCVPDLRLSNFSRFPMLSDVNCGLSLTKSKNPLVVNRAIDGDDYQRLMKLKEIAEDNKDHHKLLQLHAQEMRARRWNTMGYRTSIADFLYSILSDYGQSMSRPIYALIVLITSFSLVFQHLAIENIPPLKYLVLRMVEVSYLDTLVFSTINSIGFLSIQKAAQKNYMQSYLTGMDFSLVNILVGLEGFLALPCLFLIGLAIRNRFKI